MHAGIGHMAGTPPDMGPPRLGTPLGLGTPPELGLGTPPWNWDPPELGLETPPELGLGTPPLELGLGTPQNWDLESPHGIGTWDPL